MVDFDMYSDENDTDLMKEVFSTENISTRTELTPLQIENINKLKTLAVIFGNKILENHTNDFMKLQKSKNRASMHEFIAAMKARNDPELGQNNILKKLTG